MIVRGVSMDDIVIHICAAAVIVVLIVAVLVYRDVAQFYRNESEKLRETQNRAFEKIVDAHVADDRKSPRVKTKLRLVASAGRRIEKDAPASNVIDVDFRNKTRTDPDDSGPEGAA